MIDLVDVGHFECMTGRAVDQHRVRQRRSLAGAPQRSDAVAALFPYNLENLPRPRQHGTVETHAKPVEKAQFDAVDDTGR